MGRDLLKTHGRVKSYHIRGKLLGKSGKETMRSLKQQQKKP